MNLQELLSKHRIKLSRNELKSVIGNLGGCRYSIGLCRHVQVSCYSTFGLSNLLCFHINVRNDQWGFKDIPAKEWSELPYIRQQEERRLRLASLIKELEALYETL